MSGRIFLYLLDGPRGHPVQFWSIEGQTLVRIGRALDNDVVIPHPRVSRAHAYLTRIDGEWRLTALSTQGILHVSGVVHDLTLTEGDEFGLGRGGPALRFASSKPADQSLGLTTFSTKSGGMMPLLLDKTRLSREVDAIASDPYFQKLQAITRKLRGP